MSLGAEAFETLPPPHAARLAPGATFMKASFLLGMAVAMAALASAVRAEGPPVDWSGMYVGGTAGYGWGDSHQFDAVAHSPELTWEGAVLGGTVGYNWHTGHLVAGFEADISWSGIEGSFKENLAVWGCGAGAAPSCINSIEWFGTVRGRVGVAIDHVLPYVTGGFAFGGVLVDFTVCNTCKTSTETGWTAGGGVEWDIGHNWSMKAEYLYVDLGKDVPSGNTIGADAAFNVVKSGANLRF